ncbi:MAG: head GIN domain-containing protein [Burkholderiaceae bacterium]
MKIFIAAVVAIIGPLVAAPAASAADPPPTVAAATSGNGERIKGSGRIVEDRRALAGFVAVHLNGPINVELKASDRDGVMVRTDDNIAPLIETRVTGGERPALEIGLTSGASFRTARTPVVVVEFRALSELVMRGSGDIRADRLTAEDFALSMSGSGDLRIDTLQATRLAAVLSGSGDLIVSGGRADDQAYRLSGSGDVSAGRVEGRRVQVSISGSGDAVVNASETLEAAISGTGDIAYRGNARVTQRIRGTGSVHKLR